jgi:branched-chain amino acid transport system substrate-binding protein
MKRRGSTRTVCFSCVVLFTVFLAGEPAAAQSVRIGVLAPLTGMRADSGHYITKSLQLAGEEINQDAKRKYKLEFIFEDSKYEPAAAVTGTKKLIEVDKVSYIIGPHGSSETLAIAPIAEKARVILITPASQVEEISQAGDYIFRLIHNTTQEAPWFAEFVAQKMKSDTIHYLSINTAIISYLTHFRPVLEKRGKKVGLVEEFDAKETDFRIPLLRIKAQHATDVFFIATPRQIPLILNQAKEIGLEVQFYTIGIEGPDILKAGALAEGLLYPYSYDNSDSDEPVRRFYQTYSARFHIEPDTIAANSYDAAFLLSNCFERFGTDSQNVKSCLYQTKNYHGASGTFSIDENGDAVKALIVKTVRNGKFAKY